MNIFCQQQYLQHWQSGFQINTELVLRGLITCANKTFPTPLYNPHHLDTRTRQVGFIDSFCWCMLQQSFVSLVYMHLIYLNHNILIYILESKCLGPNKKSRISLSKAFKIFICSSEANPCSAMDLFVMSHYWFVTWNVCAVCFISRTWIIRFYNFMMSVLVLNALQLNAWTWTITAGKIIKWSNYWIW